jgi:hypothetical protein
MSTLRDFIWFMSMATRSIGILFLFYMLYINIGNISLLIVFLISLGSFGAAFFSKDVGKYSWGRKSLNYTIALIGFVIVLKEYS